MIAHLQQQQSFFQFKGSIQELVWGVVAAYWALVQARTELWAREQQVEQAKQSYDRADAQFRLRIASLADASQPRLAYFNFRANLVAARANVLQREAALRNLLGLPPEDGRRLVPSTPPTRDRVQFNWDELVQTAQTQRPDIVELNLILLADQQRLIQSRWDCDGLGRKCAVRNCCWHGIGRIFNRDFIRSNILWQLSCETSIRPSCSTRPSGKLVLRPGRILKCNWLDWKQKQKPEQFSKRMGFTLSRSDMAV